MGGGALMITFGQLGTSRTSDDVSYGDMALTGLIQELKAADMNLKIAMEQGDDENIQAADESLVQIINHLLAFECGSKEDCKILYSLLVERFIKPELVEASVGHNVCKKILKHFD